MPSGSTLLSIMPYLALPGRRLAYADVGTDSLLNHTRDASPDAMAADVPHGARRGSTPAGGGQ